MVDTNRRKKLAFHLRQLTVGLATNDDFEEAIAKDISFGSLPEQYYRSQEVKSDDPIIRPILEIAWQLYNDTEQHKLIGKHELNEYQLKEIARFILFLHSDLEYAWPDKVPTNALLRTLQRILHGLRTLVQSDGDKVEELEDVQSAGDIKYWPFLRKEHFEKQLEKQPFLRGQIKANA